MNTEELCIIGLSLQISVALATGCSAPPCPVDNTASDMCHKHGGLPSTNKSVTGGHVSSAADGRSVARLDGSRAL